MSKVAVHTFTLDEQETTFTIDATDRSLVRVYSNDPVFIARLEKVGAKVHRRAPDGGMFYDLRDDQLVLRKGKRKVSEAQGLGLERWRQEQQAKGVELAQPQEGNDANSSET
jgi:hypothetical protein